MTDRLRFIQTRWRKDSPWMVFNFRGLDGVHVLEPDYDARVDAQVMLVLAWCNAQFGPVNHNRWFGTRQGFCFISETDATAFKLRWC